MISADLSTITVSDLRSVRGKFAIPLSAPVVLLHGSNGAGKSTVMSAIELALTGQVTGFEVADDGDLVYRGRRKATVKLIADEEPVELTITKEGIDGTPLLSAEDGKFFGERCYLQQRALAQLLDIYESDGKSEESPLTQFVNELLGLDELDALIGGLYPGAHMARVKQLVPEYGDLARGVKLRQGKLESLRRDLQEQRSEAAASRAQVNDALAALGAPDGHREDDDRARAWLTEGAAEDERALLQLIETQRDLISFRARAAEFKEGAGAKDFTELEAAVEAAHSAANSWRASHGAVLEALLTEMRTMLPGTPAVAGAVDPEAVRTEALGAVEAELVRL